MISALVFTRLKKTRTGGKVPKMDQIEMTLRAALYIYPAREVSDVTGPHFPGLGHIPQRVPLETVLVPQAQDS